MGFNWQKYEAWRKHPMLQTRLSSAVSEKTSLAEPRRRGNAGHARRLLPLALLAGTTEACRTARLSLSLSRARARVLLPPLAKNSTQQSLTSTVSSSSSFSFSQCELQVPGFGIGVALFGVYMIAETASKAVGGTKPQKGHH